MRHSEARALGLARYNTGRACVRGHLSDRYVSDGHCIECALQDCAERRSTPEWKAWKRSYEQTPEAAALKAKRNARWLAKPGNAEAYRSTKRGWQQCNRARGRMYTATRNARLKNATPPWADMAAILAVYAEAERISAATGVPHEVDHFYPIAGRDSCGLHVPWNLRVIPSLDNKRKSNRTPVVDGRSLKYYSDRPGLRIEIREMIEPTP